MPRLGAAEREGAAGQQGEHGGASRESSHGGEGAHQPGGRQGVEEEKQKGRDEKGASQIRRLARAEARLLQAGNETVTGTRASPGASAFTATGEESSP